MTRLAAVLPWAPAIPWREWLLADLADQARRFRENVPADWLEAWRRQSWHRAAVQTARDRYGMKGVLI